MGANQLTQILASNRIALNRTKIMLQRYVGRVHTHNHKKVVEKFDTKKKN